MNNQKFIELITELQAYYKAELTSFGLKTWYKYLSQNLTIEELAIAIEKTICENRYMPTPKELVESVQGNELAIATTEFNLILKGAEQNKPLSEINISEIAKKAINHMGGINAIGMAQTTKIPFLKKEFIELYLSNKTIDFKKLQGNNNNGKTLSSSN